MNNINPMCYEVAVCEDEPLMLEKLCELCGDVLSELQMNCHIMPYLSADSLYKVLKAEPGKYNLLLLDIQMDAMNGMELGKELRKSGNEVSIIFVTSSDDYLKDGYSVHPIEYLFKPVQKKELLEAVKFDIDKNYLSDVVTFQTGNNKFITVAMNDIYFLEGQNHNIIFHTTKEVKKYSVSLADIAKMLPQGNFVRCHKSYMVNLEYVREITRSSMKLSMGRQLPIGRKYYKSFQESFVRYMNK